MNKYTQQVTEMFYNQNPDKKKLEFGCEVSHHGRIKTILHQRGHFFLSEYGLDISRIPIHHLENQTSQATKILGKPITTLQAISLLEDKYFVSKDGLFKIYFSYNDNWVESVNLDLDPTIALFKDQPVEVQKQIAELLGII